MKQIGEVAGELVDHNLRSSKSEPPADSQHEKIMKGVWVRMAEIFGHRWTANYGKAPSVSWSKALAKVSVEQIGVGLGNVSESNPPWEWPPTLSQFLDLCKEYAAPCHRPFKVEALPPPRDPSVAREHIAKMREILRR